MKTNELVQNNYYTKNSNLKIERNKIYKDFKIVKKNKLKLNNIIFTEEGNLFTNNKNNLIINSGRLNINSNHIENTTSIKHKKMPFLNRKRKNTLTIKSDNKEVAKIKK